MTQENKSNAGRKKGIPRVPLSTNIKKEVKTKLNLLAAAAGKNGNEIIEDLVEQEYNIKKSNNEIII